MEFAIVRRISVFDTPGQVPRRRTAAGAAAQPVGAARHDELARRATGDMPFLTPRSTAARLAARSAFACALP